MELRCPHKLHARIDEDVIEVSCLSRLCGKQAGIVVLHRFSLSTGKLIETRRFRDPVRPEPERDSKPEMGVKKESPQIGREASEGKRNNGSGHCIPIRDS